MNDPTRRGLNPAPPARLRNISKQPAKVALVIPPGDELVVSDDVAAQLLEARVGLQEANDTVDALGDAAATAVATPPASEAAPVVDVSKATKKQLLELIAEGGLNVDTGLKVSDLRAAVAAALTSPSTEATPEA